MISLADNYGGVASACQNLSLINKRITPIYLKKNKIFLIKEVIKTKKTLILMHFEPIFFVPILKILKKKYICVIHTDLAKYFENCNFIKKITIRIYLKIIKNDLIIFTSKESELNSKKKFNLPNTLTIYNFTPKIESVAHIPKGVISLGIVSRLDKNKNIDFAIKIFSLLKGKNIILNIFGDGPERINLEKYAKKLNISEKIIFHGYESKKSNIYSKINATLSFSSLEGFAVSLVESINQNIPAFHTDCSSGPREIFAPDSNPTIKTKSFELYKSGMLVKPLNRKSNYELSISAEDKEYLHYLSIFIDKIKSNYFDFSNENLNLKKSTINIQWNKVLDEMDGGFKP